MLFVVGLPSLLARSGTLEEMLGCFEKAAQDVKGGQPATPGIGPLWHMMRDPENQETLRFIFALGKRMRTSCVTRDK